MEMSVMFPELPLKVVHTSPSVCAQRNVGVRLCSSSFILLMDDDIEVPTSYISTIMDFIEYHPDAGAVTGVILEPSLNGYVTPVAQTVSCISLCWSFVFQLTVWTDVNSMEASFPMSLILPHLKRYYKKKGNTWTSAGWPLVTQIDPSGFRTTVFGLGAAVVRRDWLLDAPFDERLDTHGIGDNYGVAMNLPGETPIVVLPRLQAFHHRSTTNRLHAATTYRRRVLALHYFMRRLPHFRRWNEFALLWSLIGNLLSQLARGEFRLAWETVHAFTLIAMFLNPYGRSPRRSEKSPLTLRHVEPHD
jgi:GT2 family glycosyltransferase